MSDWRDPNIRNHVSGDDTNFKYNDFTEQYIFKDRTSQEYYPYSLNDLHNNYNFIYKSLDNEKLNKYIDILSDESPLYKFSTSSNYKPMQDSYYSMGNVYLYQIILNINKLWNIYEYNNVNKPYIIIPNSNNITKLLTDILSNKHFHNMHELINEDDIRQSIEKVIIDIQNDASGISNIISKKLYMDQNNIIKRLNSPLIKKYLCNQLSKIFNKEINQEKLIIIINDMLKVINIYIRNNNNIYNE